MGVPTFLQRFNPRLHPLLALGMGLGVVALFVPSPGRESHSTEEILESLASPVPDLDHGPVFWLGEIQAGSELWREAQARCGALPAGLSPNCELLASLEALVRSLDPPETEPIAPPEAQPEALEETP